MATAGMILFALCGIALIVGRRPAAQLQALLAGATVVPGCAVAEGITFLLLALMFFLLQRGGVLG